MFCGGCGTPLGAGSRFCPRCGRPWVEPPPVPAGAGAARVRGGRGRLIAVLLLLAGAGVAVGVWLARRGGGGSSGGGGSGGGRLKAAPELRVTARTSATVGPEGGRVATEGIELRFPAGALRAATPVEVGVLDVALTPPDANLVLLSPVWDLDAGPGAFAAPVDVTISYEPARLPAGRTPDQLIGVLATATGYQRLPVAAVDAAQHTVTLRLPHFSRPAIAVLATPSHIVKRHPELPFDIAVVDAHPAKDPAMVDVLYRSIETAYRKLTPHGNRAEPFAAPPHGAGRLLVEVTSLDYLKSQYAAGFIPSGVAHSHDLLQIDSNELTVGPPWDAAIHEFFHVIQWTYRERAIELGARGRWSSFLAEATAGWAAHSVVPPWPNAELPAVSPEFCFVPLTYDPFAARDPDVGHAYQAVIFMHYLTARLGGGAVNRVLGQAFQDVTDDTEVLERAIRELDPKESLDSIYHQFVLDFLFHQRFGARAIHERRPDVLTVPERHVSTLELGPAGAQEARVTRDLQGRRHALAGVIKLVPSVPAGARQQLTLELAGRGWLWAIAEDAAGKQALLGGGPTVRARIDDQTRAVWLLPVSYADAALTLTARLGGAAPLSWKLAQVEITPPGGSFGESDDLSTMSGKVTETSIGWTTQFKSGNSGTSELTWTRPPERLVEGEPFSLELTGRVTGSARMFSAFLILAPEVRGSAGIDVAGKPGTSMGLDLQVGIDYDDRPTSRTLSGQFVPVKALDPSSDNATQAIQFYSAHGSGVTFIYQRE